MCIVHTALKIMECKKDDLNQLNAGCTIRSVSLHFFWKFKKKKAIGVCINPNEKNFKNQIIEDVSRTLNSNA